MWWYLPTVVGALLVLLLARSLRGLMSRGSVGGIRPPWVLLPMALLVAHGPPWILWVLTRRPGAAPGSVHLVVYGILAALVLPIAVALVIAWFKGRRPGAEGTCIACGHHLLDPQPTCPECGKERAALQAAGISSGLRRERGNHPLLFAMVDGYQAFLLLGTAVVMALLLIPTPRMVTSQRSSGTSNGTVFKLRNPDGLDHPFTLASTVRSHVRSVASFALPLPGFPSDIALDVSVEGVIRREREGASVGDPVPVAIAAVVHSRAELDALLAQMNCGSFGLTIAQARDPLVKEADIVRMTAAGYWPLPDPNGVVPEATMARADRILAIGEITPAAVSLGIPIPIGLLAYGMLRRGRGEAPDAAA
jgi:hypothetical protein